MEYSALIVAAGSGSRMGLGYNKMLYQLQDGKTILETTVAIFQKDNRCKQIIVVGSSDDLHTYTSLFNGGNIVFVLGGDTRQESVYHGLLAVSQDHVLIHDGARPWLSMECLDRLCDTLQQHPACLLMVPVKDTIKQVEDGVVKQTLKRSTLWQAQTPQAFETKLILKCHKKAQLAHIEATDDAQLAEVCGDVAVTVVEGSYENVKVTTIEDIEGR